MQKTWRIRDLEQAMDEGKLSAVKLVKQALQRIDDPQGEGQSTFIRVYREQALAAAVASDTLRAAGLKRSPLEGIPISIKDLFDYQGDVTRGASAVLKQAEPASCHAEIVQRLLQAGAIIIGRTNMTEFAFSGLGLNPHYGTPAAPWQREQRHIPGGSSSGAGVSVADHMAIAAIGTDTGGSIRIPATFCEVVGFKPTAARIPTRGVMPLSHSLDSSGPIAASVECCAIVDAVLSGEDIPDLSELPINRLRLLVPINYVLGSADKKVKADFATVIDLLKAAGAHIDFMELTQLDQLPYINRDGGFVCAEAYFHHRTRIEHHAEKYDPLVLTRILLGKEQNAADYLDLLQQRETWIESMESELASYDAMLLPTVAISPPTIDFLAKDESAYFEANAVILRNPAIINFLDGCAVSLPCHAAGTAPVGLMIANSAYTDHHVLRVAQAIENFLHPLRHQRD